MTDFSPHAGSPIAIKALVASLLVTSGVQAWQLFGDPDVVVPEATASLPPVFLNLTLPEHPQEPAPESALNPPPASPAPPPAEPEPASPPPPPLVIVAEERMYEVGVDFQVEALISATPLTFTPWTGTGMPYILVFYQGLNDTHMLHHAYMYMQEGTGYDVCTHGLIHFWKWTALEPSAPGTKLLYESEPVPDNLLNLAGSGENCYSRLVVDSSWRGEVCMEGDGELAKPHEETLEDGTVVRHVDVLDYCVVLQSSFS